MTRNERDLAVVAFFESMLNSGLTKMQATQKTRDEFRFLTDVPVYAARRRVKERKEAENGK